MTLTHFISTLLHRIVCCELRTKQKRALRTPYGSPVEQHMIPIHLKNNKFCILFDKLYFQQNDNDKIWHRIHLRIDIISKYREGFFNKSCQLLMKKSFATSKQLFRFRIFI